MLHNVSFNAPRVHFKNPSTSQGERLELDPARDIMKGGMDKGESSKEREMRERHQKQSDSLYQYQASQADEAMRCQFSQQQWDRLNKEVNDDTKSMLNKQRRESQK
jgi:hypothetical protein